MLRACAVRIFYRYGGRTNTALVGTGTGRPTRAAARLADRGVGRAGKTPESRTATRQTEGNRPDHTTDAAFEFNFTISYLTT